MRQMEERRAGPGVPPERSHVSRAPCLDWLGLASCLGRAERREDHSFIREMSSEHCAHWELAYGGKKARPSCASVLTKSMQLMKISPKTHPQLTAPVHSGFGRCWLHSKDLTPIRLTLVLITTPVLQARRQLQLREVESLPQGHTAPSGEAQTTSSPQTASLNVRALSEDTEGDSGQGADITHATGSDTF